MDTISGGTIATDGVIKLTIDSDKLGYIRLPNESFLTTTAGVISATNTGIAGEAIFYVPKNSAQVNIGNTSALYLAGKLKTAYSGDLLGNNLPTITGLSAENAKLINFQSCTLLADVSAPEAVTVYFQGCALTAKSIGDVIYSAYTANRLAISYNFTGGNNAIQGDVNTYLLATYGVTYATVYARLVTTNLGTILIDVAP